MSPSAHRPALPIVFDRPRPTGSAELVRLLVHFAASRGLSEQEVSARFGIDPALLEDAQGRVPLPACHRLWEELPDLLDDPALPLTLVEQSLSRTPPPFAVLFLSSPTVREGLKRLLRYERHLFGRRLFECVEGDDVVRLSQDARITARPTPSALVEFVFATLVHLTRRSTEQPFAPIEVRFSHSARVDVRRYEAFFRSTVRHEADVSALLLPDDTLDLPVASANGLLAQVLEAHYEQGLDALPPPEDDLLVAVRSVLRNMLADGRASLQAVASELGLKPRSLQRELAASGRSLREVLDELRHELALTHLQNPQHSLTDVADMLGFSDQAAFHRAFVRWQGMPPGRFRSRLTRDRNA